MLQQFAYLYVCGTRFFFRFDKCHRVRVSTLNVLNASTVLYSGRISAEYIDIMLIWNVMETLSSESDSKELTQEIRPNVICQTPPQSLAANLVNYLPTYSSGCLDTNYHTNWHKFGT